MNSQRSCGASAWMTRAARHPGIVPTTRRVPFRIASPAVGSAMTATAQPAQYGFIQPSCIAMPKTAANARPALMASLRFVLLLTPSWIARAVPLVSRGMRPPEQQNYLSSE